MRTDEPRVSVGYVRRAHGIKGEVVVRALTDNPHRFDGGQRFSTDEEPARTLVVARSRPHKDGVVVAFEGVTDRNSAEDLQGITLTIGAADRRELETDEFWPEDLQGLTAVTPSGEHLGTVSGVVLGAAQDRLVVTTATGKTVEVPFVEAIVGDVHPSLGHVVVDAPEGLF
jgi:16S rRNA processing protein RimM